MTTARSVRVRGVVQGVGFRPFVFRLARANSLAGWVRNGEDGVEIHLEGSQRALDAFLKDLEARPPAAARIAGVDVQLAEPGGLTDFTIRESRRRGTPTVRISPDLPVCEDCLAELFDPKDPRFHYPYINCTNCGPRYSVILRLPYDRRNTTMKDWPLDEYCDGQYRDPMDRRFHAQPVACPACGPGYRLEQSDDSAFGEAAIAKAVDLLREGKILAVKGIGGYHFACDGHNAEAAAALRERKFRKEKPFALMARDLECARALVELTPEAEALLLSAARPIVLAPARISLPAIAPDCDELGVMLPYTPMHHLLFAAGAPDFLVMTSANRSSEPIAYLDGDARESAEGIADAFLLGERPIARRVDDSVARAGAFGPVILRRARGYAPGAVAVIPSGHPILAVGADLKNTICLVAGGGQAFVSQHIGDLDDYRSYEAYCQTVADLTSMYETDWSHLTIACDAHPEYRSSVHAAELGGARMVKVQHHRAHVASVLAERGAWDKRVLGVSFDGTGYGDDGSIWGGEIFTGSVREGFERVAHLRPASLAGDAAARYPVQAAAGFLAQVDDLPDLGFPERFEQSLDLVRRNVRTFPTTSVGRLFDAAAAILGFRRAVTFEGQAAMWVEHLARRAPQSAPYPFPDLDYRPLLHALAVDCARGRTSDECAAAFQNGIARGLFAVCESRGVDTVVLSGGVFQNELLLETLKRLFDASAITVWTNRAVPPNDGGISLGQAALAAFVRTE